MGENERDRAGDQKGAQTNAEGQHGDKAHSHKLEELHAGPSGEERGNRPESGAPKEGHHRLFEDREQHDEAEKNSEKNRAEVETERGRHPIDEVRYGGKPR